MQEKSTPRDLPMWKFVGHASFGGIDTYLWHRQGSNLFCWRPVGKYWDAAKIKKDDAA